MGNLDQISVILLTKGDVLKETWNSLKYFNEVVMINTGPPLVQAPFPNTTLLHAPYEGDLTRHQGIEKAKHDWILSIDSDEVLSPELIHEIDTLLLSRGTVYSIPFKNFFNGRFIRGCGWYPDRHVRLFHRKDTAFEPVRIHSSVMTHQLNVKKLQNAILHYSYRSIGDFLQKMQLYSALYATEFEGKKKGSLSKAIFHGFFAFFKSYIIKRGFLDGKEGWIISAYQGHMAYYKYLKLMEKSPLC
ncbi:MAG: glycosyltransferase family 2 protein [Simkaniaceae bacterium]|nr:glycosyltransferase family 2 protein [Simkaniaceae bacterium]